MNTPTASVPPSDMPVNANTNTLSASVSPSGMLVNTNTNPNTPFGFKDVKNVPTPGSEPKIQPLHQGAIASNTLEMQRQLLQKKLAEKPSGLTSPTDDMMTPCSKKLQAHKIKAYKKAKPQLLSKAFSKVAAESQQEKKSMKKSDLSSLRGKPFGE
ncbi:hypothetical protein RUND412_003354 [Rhizina undulata]